LALALATPAAAGFERDLVEGREVFVAELETLATWCRDVKLLGRRDAVYEVLLRFDDEHQDARRILKYRRTTDGGWVQRGGYKPRRDRGDAADMLEFEGLYRAVVDRHRARIRTLRSRYAGELSGDDARALWQDVLALDPHDAEAHRELGEESIEVAGEPCWVLAESAATLAATDADADDRRAPVAITVVGGTDEERAAAEAELGRLVRLFHLRLPAHKRLPAHVTVHLLDEGGRDGFLARPEFDDRARAAAGSVTSAWVPGKAEIGLWDLPEFRREQAVRQVATLLLEHGYGITPTQGAVFEGLAAYFTRAAYGTHFSSHVPGLHFAPTGSRSDAVDFEAAAMKAIAAGKLDLQPLLALPLPQLEAHDVGLAWALERYLLEGCPEAAGRVHRRVGNGEPAGIAIASELTIGLDALEQRLARWASEVAPRS
jgi:hypothetical protein